LFPIYVDAFWNKPLVFKKMKIIISAFALLLISINLNAKIIYIEPVQNAQYVNIYNNVIIGFDEIILSSDLNSLITVTGSLSGVHTGEIISTDKKKLIFKPHLPFAFNEKVEVKLNHIKTSVTINNSLSYSFQTQTKSLKRDSKNTILEESGYSSEKSFVNFPDVNNFPQITVTVSNNPSPGYIFMSNFPFTPIPNTPYLIIANNDGTPYFSRQLTSNGYAFQKQINGYLTYYSGADQKFYALDSQYNLIDSFYAGNGYITDVHELQILSNGHALLMIYDPQIVDMSQLVPGGNSKAIVDGLIIQEIDVNKNVVFQWRSWDHIRITDAIHEDLTAAYVDYVHGNAIERDNDGNILICSRHLSEITKINRTTGDIIWRLGGVRNEFTFVNDSIGFSYQHDIRRLPNGNITMYDNGNFRGQFSRAVEYQLDEINKTATLVWQYRNTPELYGFAMGSVQRLPGGNTLICWGSANPNITEVTPQGTKALEMTFSQGIYTYRAFKTDMPAPRSKDLTLSSLVQGFYDASTNLMIPDTMRVYLRNLTSPYSIIDSSKALLNNSGFGLFSFSNNIIINDSQYYVQLKHRNSIETWSNPFSFVNDEASYSFLNSASAAFGGNQIQVDNSPIRFAIYSGDVNQDGFVNLNDIILISNNSSNFINGYVNTDLNGDNITNLNDILLSYNNSKGFVSVVRP